MRIRITEKEINRWRRKKNRLLVLAGRGKSGKDICVDYLLRNYGGMRHYRIADAPVKIAKLLGLPPERKILQALFGVNALLRPLLGRSAYINRVVMLLDKEKPKLALVEAIRPKEEYQEFVAKRGGVLIGVRAHNRIRYGRAVADVKKGQEKHDEGRMTFREFLARDKTPMERDVDWILGRANFVIDNNSNSRQEFYQQIDKVASRLGLKKKRRV